MPTRRIDHCPQPGAERRHVLHPEVQGRTIGALDPGAEGGIAIFRGEEVLLLSPNPQDGKAFVDLVQPHLEALQGVFYVEDVGASAFFGGKKMAASASFSFGFNTGRAWGALETLGLRMVPVRPQVWQKEILGKIPKGSSKAYALRAFAKRWPALEACLVGNEKQREGQREAALIALWARITHGR